MTLLWAARLAAVFAVAVACYLTLTPDPNGAGLLPDYVGHLGIFAGVGASFAVLRRASGWSKAALGGLGFAVVVIGGGTEIGQSFTTRDPGLRDFAFDVIGGVSGLLLADWAAPRVWRGLDRVNDPSRSTGDSAP
ncbi:MAG: hypothetical protein EPO65_05635 [Dehalococcoidia bacterium]|nr:MAG: hypothetical protein EPO65_05635 [Dehalococcoidia bacterium]